MSCEFLRHFVKIFKIDISSDTNTFNYFNSNLDIFFTTVLPDTHTKKFISLKFDHEQINYKAVNNKLIDLKSKTARYNLFEWSFRLIVKLTFLPSATFVWFPILTMWTPMCPPTVYIWKCNNQQTQDYHSRYIHISIMNLSFNLGFYSSFIIYIARAKHQFAAIGCLWEIPDDVHEKNNIQGSHPDWKTWKTWKNGKAFSSQGKVREFWTDWKSQGKSHKILENWDKLR